MTPFRRRRESARHKALLAILKAHLRIEITCHQDYFGIPEARVSLWLDDECIADSMATIQEHAIDPDW